MKRPVAIIGSARTPFSKIGTSYIEYSALDLMVGAITALADKFPIKQERLGEVAVGTVFQHPSVWNFAREVVIRAKLNPETPGLTISRACATSLDAAFVVAQKIASGHIEVGIAGGAESMSGVPMYLPPRLAKQFIKYRQSRGWGDRFKALSGISFGDVRVQGPAPEEPSSGLLMGDHCEKMAQEWKIGRKEQDELAFLSHQNGVKAWDRGFYDGIVAPFGGLKKDSILRADTTLERLAKLKPAFERSEKGTLTAGNSSPLTDGASCVLLGSEEWAKKHGLPVLAYLTDVETAAIDITKEGLLMAPAYAVPRLLKRNDRRLQSFDYYEIHEAFSAQVLCTLKAWETPEFFTDRLHMEGPLGSIDREKLNVAGGSVALGHPFGATGTRVLGTMAKLLAEKGSGKGLVSICTGGGMGTTALVDR